MAIQTQTERRATAAERQRRHRARLRGEQPEHRVVECPWCQRLWVPQRQGTLCSRSCVESAGRLKRRLTVSDASWADDTTRMCLELQPRIDYLCNHRGGGHWTDRLGRMRRLGLLTPAMDDQLRQTQPEWASDQWWT